MESYFVQVELVSYNNPWICPKKKEEKVNVQEWTSVQRPSLSDGVEIPNSDSQLQFLIECCP
jgi:hypothetical protein